MPNQSLRRVHPRRPWTLAVLAALLAAATLAPGANAAGRPQKPASGKVVPPKTGTWVGTYEEANGSQLVKQERLLDLESQLGRKVDVDHTYTAWTSTFPGWRETWDTANGRVPFVSWAPASTAAVNSGRYDSMIRQRAVDVKAAGFPILLEWFWEMDGARNKHIAGSPASFISAWKRIHGIFDRAGVTNVSWVWCPNAWGFFTGEAQKFYPGDAYVDWICANGYNWSPGRKGDEWRSFEYAFQPFYDWASQRGKPLMVGEFGVMERKPGEKAQWLKDAGTALKTKFPDIKAVVYFNVKKVYNWRLSTSSSAQAAFKAMAKTLQGG
ncbi:MAG TPA: glycosyl hydrolase [Acidimicrobiia bacterium]|nr:glycosyl hydrolase [Acidimicrobiia bacterium]